MLNSLFSSGVTALSIIYAAISALFAGLLFAFIISLKLRSSKGFFITVSLMPMVVTIAFSFLNIVIASDSTSAITKVAVVMVGLGLIRFRSAQGSSEEILSLFTSVVIGTICGLGYWLFGMIIAVAISSLYLILMHLNIFTNKKLSEEKLLKVTIPENLEYSDVFSEVFSRYLKTVEIVGVKTTGMGSMFRLSYRVVMKKKEEEKAFIDELRTKNGNLEISILPYTLESKEL